MSHFKRFVRFRTFYDLAVGATTLNQTAIIQIAKVLKIEQNGQWESPWAQFSTLDVDMVVYPMQLRL